MMGQVTSVSSAHLDAAKGFTPQRLDIARKRRGLTKGELATALGVSSRMVTGYLSGEYEPSAATLQKMPAALNFPPGFFTAPNIDVPAWESASFRAQTSLTARQRDQATAAACCRLKRA